jgi:putative spermidine/putrescine transport system ATP-binding protein
MADLQSGQTLTGESIQSLSAGVSIRGLTKNFGAVEAVAGVNLDIPQGEFFSMLGPSGSGKTTVLRMIAGFETASAGKIYLDGADVTEQAPFDREVNTVFQDYALFPHMSIQDNVEFGLRAKKLSPAEREAKATEAINQVKLGHLADRLPHQLSGGQRQRIALARALVLRPKLLLLDEPLGALDKQLREEMQIELKNIQRESKITFIFVTHDQEEAMRMSDRIAVFNAGRIEQIGTPQEVYEKPATAFVAGFLGSSNIFDANNAAMITGSNQMINIRPERIKLVPNSESLASDEQGVQAVIQDTAFLGANTLFLLEANGLSMIATRVNEELPGETKGFAAGDRVLAKWKKSHVTSIPN